jgi:rubredoxin
MAASTEGGDFDSILGEGSSYQEAASALQNTASSSPVVRVPDGSTAATVSLTSSVATPDIYGDDLALEEEAATYFDGDLMEEEAAATDPLLNNEILKRQHQKKLKREQRKAAGGVMRYVRNPLLLVKGKDFSDVTLTILIPAFVSYLALKKLSDIGFGKLGEKADELYEQAAGEIAYHVGDYEEMEATYKDYKKKLWFNGAPSYVNSELVKRLAVAYSTQVSVTPKSVSSLAYLLTMMKIPDVEAAESFVTACRENPNSMSIASKVLFYSEHVFKDKAAKKKMSPLIKQLSEMFGGIEAVMEQQRDMAESAYRDAVAEAGQGQTKITEGWKALGLDKDTATRIFEETKALGFLSREELWEKQEQDAARDAFAAEERAREELRNSIDKDGNLIDPDEDIDPDKLINPEDLNKDYEDDEDDSIPSTGGAKECGNCGYTLFIAAGREGKFFSSGFTCPECGAARDQFKDVDIEL